jgi:hypothetical protein
MPKREFDTAELSMAVWGGYYLSTCTRSLTNLETQDRAEMISNGQYGFFNGILSRYQEPLSEPAPAKQSGKRHGG